MGVETTLTETRILRRLAENSAEGGHLCGEWSAELAHLEWTAGPVRISPERGQHLSCGPSPLALMGSCPFLFLVSAFVEEISHLCSWLLLECFIFQTTVAII